MIKYILFFIVLGAVYFLFLKDPYPKIVEFNGYTLSSRQDNNNTLKKNIDIFSYRDKSNHHVLLFGIADGDVTVSEISSHYVARFESQGVKFKRNNGRILGVKSDEVVYITEAKAINALIVYMEKGASPIPDKPNDAAILFNKLENYTF